MKLKPQPSLPRSRRRPTRPSAPRRRSGGSGQARRPGASLARRLGKRLPSVRRLLAGTAATAGVAGIVFLLNGPLLRVSATELSGDHYADRGALEAALATARGGSVLGIDTDAIAERMERLPAVADATVSASLDGMVTATVVEHAPAFVWETSTALFIGAADGTIFAGGRGADALSEESAGLPRIVDTRFAARVVTIGDVIPDAILRVALRLAAVEPAALGSTATSFSIALDDEYGFRLVSGEGGWEVALGVYGLDPEESLAEADARLERQVTAVRTLFAERPEADIGWVDVRNPGKVYFRAKG